MVEFVGSAAKRSFLGSARAMSVVVSSVMFAGCSDHGEPLGPLSAQNGSPAVQVVEGGKLHLRGSGVAMAPVWPAFQETSRFFLAGTKPRPGVCHFQQDSVRVPRHQRIVDRLIEVDTIGCTFIVARGIAPPFSEQASGTATKQEAFGPVLSQVNAAFQLAPAGPRRLNGTRDCGWPGVDFNTATQTIYWHDPAFLPVVSDQVQLTWSYNWICVSSDARGYHEMNWFTPTGWSILSWYTYPLNLDYYNQWIEAKGRSTFRNPGFPTGFPLCTSAVTATVSTNRVTGYIDGIPGFDSGVDLTGPSCIALLFLVVDRGSE